MTRNDYETVAEAMRRLNSTHDQILVVATVLDAAFVNFKKARFVAAATSTKED